MKKTLIALTILALASTGFAQATKKLELVVPTQQMVGTPVPIKLENLEPKTPNPKPDVPVDVENVAKGKNVTSSDDFPLIGDLTLITDGDKAGAEGCFVELMNGLQWVQIDLEKETEIFAIALWMFHSQERAYKDVIIQISNDEDFKDGVQTIFNSDHDNSSGLGKGTDKAWIQTNEGKLIVLKSPLKAKYVRVFSNGNTTNDTNHFIEIEIYGR